MRSWACPGPVLLTAPLNLVDQAATRAQEHVRARPEGLTFDPAEHHRLTALSADRRVSAHAAHVWGSIDVHRSTRKSPTCCGAPPWCYVTSRLAPLLSTNAGIAQYRIASTAVLLWTVLVDWSRRPWWMSRRPRRLLAKPRILSGVPSRWPKIICSSFSFSNARHALGRTPICTRQDYFFCKRGDASGARTLAAPSTRETRSDDIRCAPHGRAV
jgi:hypothetical protein